MVIDSLVGAAWLSSAVFPVQRCQDGSKEVAVGLHTSPARRNPETSGHGRPEHQGIFCDWGEVKYLPDLSKDG